MFNICFSCFMFWIIITIRVANNDYDDDDDDDDDIYCVLLQIKEFE